MRIQWEPQKIDVGVDRGVLYLPLDGDYESDWLGEPWNGLTSVTDKNKSEKSSAYLDATMYNLVDVKSDPNFLVEAFTYPDRFETFISDTGLFVHGQHHRPFGFSYQSGGESGKLHIVYNILATCSDSSYSSIDSNISHETFSFEFFTTPSQSLDWAPTAHFIIDLDKIYPEVSTALSDILYGSDSGVSHLPSSIDLHDLFESSGHFQVTDNGDGTWTVVAPDSGAHLIGPDTYELSWESVEILNIDEFRMKTW